MTRKLDCASTQIEHSYASGPDSQLIMRRKKTEYETYFILFAVLKILYIYKRFASIYLLPKQYKYSTVDYIFCI
jgi:hypothetical protein